MDWESHKTQVIDNFNKRLSISEKKSHDYATEDILSNFKRVSLILKTLNVNCQSPQGYCLALIILKLDRLCNLLNSSKAPKYESINDTFNDLQNYIDLLCSIVSDVHNDTLSL